MKSSTEVFHRAGRERLALFVLCATLFCGASALLALPAPSAKRFLFIVDASASMKPFEGSVREAIFDSLNTGLHGKMTNGDTYGIWLVNEQNDTSFRMEMWKKKFAVEMAAKAAMHVKDHGFKGKLALNEAMTSLAAVIHRVEDLTIILISNGETPITGTPYDDVINLRFRELAPVMKSARAALITTFVVQERELVAWAANSPESMISFPDVPPRHNPVKVEVALGTNTPPPSVKAATMAAPAQAESEPVKPRVTLPSIIITKESVALERKSYASLATSVPTNEPAPSASATNAEVTAVAATNRLVIETNAAVSERAVATTLAPTNEAAAEVTSTKVETTDAGQVASRVASVRLEKVSSTGAETSPRSTPALLWAAVGAGVTLTIVLGIFLLVRSRRQVPSLVTQALVRERMS